MSHTVSRGIKTTAHYVGVTTAIVCGLRQILANGASTSEDIPFGATAAINRFFDAAISDINQNIDPALIVRFPPMERMTTYLIAYNAGQAVSIKRDKELKTFLLEAKCLLQKFCNPSRLAETERGTVERVIRFLDQIRETGEVKRTRTGLL